MMANTTGIEDYFTPQITSNARLDIRDLVVDAGGHTLIATQYPTVTTGWWETRLPNGVNTWVPVVYTQTFATTFLDQLGPPQVGTIGLGNATENVVDNGAATTKDAGVTGWGHRLSPKLRIIGTIACGLLFLSG